MKAICYMSGAGHKYQLPDWFKHEAVIDISMAQILELYAIGFSVTMLHFNKDEANKQMLICVDDRV